MVFTPDSQKRFRSWLEHKLNKGDCLGLMWIDKDQGIFKFPWYRLNDLSEDMKPIAFKVFVDWAKFSNNSKYKEGMKPDYPAYKQNMRCNLNKLKGDFEKLHDNSQLKDEPHIVYRFINSRGSPRSSSSPSSEYCNNLNTDEDKFHDKNIPQVVHSLAEEQQSELCSQFLNNLPEMNVAVTNNIPEIPQACYVDFLNSPQPGIEGNFYHTQALQPVFSDHVKVDASPYNANYAEEGHEVYAPDLEYNSYQDQRFPAFTKELAEADSSPYNANYTEMGHVGFEGPSLPSDLKDLNSGELRALDVQPMSGVSSLNTPRTSLELNAFLQPTACATSQDVGFKVSSINKMNVKVSYGQPFVDVLNETVGENGCKLFFGNRLLARTQHEQELYGPKEVPDIMLPIVDQCLAEVNEKYVRVISQILEETVRGFTLTFKDGDIYAQRLCRSRVYYCDAYFHSKCLDRKSKTPEKVFDFQDFCQKLADCLKYPNKHTKPPPAHFYITIGTEVNPAHKNGPLSKVAICICVTHQAAEEMYNQAQAARRTGQGDSLQPAHSGLDSCDQLLEMYKALTINPLNKE